MNSKEIFRIALGLSNPWYVERVEFIDSTDSKELHLYLNFERGYQFPTSTGSSSAYDTVDRTWQHLNFFQHRCYLHARVPRVKTGEGSIHQVSVPWARENSGFTLLFEAYAMLLIESEMPVSKVSECTKVTAPRIWRVFNYWIQRALSKDTLDEVTQIGMDETSRKKGHNYITLFADLEQRRTIIPTPNPSSIDIKMIKQQYHKNTINEDFLIILIQGTENLYIALYNGKEIIEK